MPCLVKILQVVINCKINSFGTVLLLVDIVSIVCVIVFDNTTCEWLCEHENPFACNSVITHM